MSGVKETKYLNLLVVVDDIGHVSITCTPFKQLVFTRRPVALKNTHVEPMTKEELFAKRHLATTGFCNFYSINFKGSLIVVSPGEFEAPGDDYELWSTIQRKQYDVKQIIIRKDAMIRQMFYSYVFSVNPNVTHSSRLKFCLSEFYKRGILYKLNGETLITGGNFTIQWQFSKQKIGVIGLYDKHYRKWIPIKFGKSLMQFICKVKNIHNDDSKSIIMLSYLMICLNRATKLNSNLYLFDFLIPHFRIYIATRNPTPLSPACLDVVELLTGSNPTMIALLNKDLYTKTPSQEALVLRTSLILAVEKERLLQANGDMGKR
jgi:hypothetical protein